MLIRVPFWWADNIAVYERRRPNLSMPITLNEKPTPLLTISCLSDRSQVDNINVCFLLCCAGTSRVIQRSVLDPVLFLLCINDIFKEIRRGTPFPFTDDIKRAYSFEAGSFKSMLAIINENSRFVGNWCTKWLMNFYVDMKTLLTYHSPRASFP